MIDKIKEILWELREYDSSMLENVDKVRNEQENAIHNSMENDLLKIQHRNKHYDGWKILSVKQPLYSVDMNMAGNADLIIYSEKIKLIAAHNPERDYSIYSGQYCQICNKDADDHYKEITEIKIIDWKTGNKNMLDKLTLYKKKLMLEEHLNKLKIGNVEITTEPVYLKGGK